MTDPTTEANQYRKEVRETVDGTKEVLICKSCNAEGTEEGGIDHYDNCEISDTDSTTSSREEQPHEDYPEEAASRLDQRSLERFAEKVEKYGEGQNWREDAPKDMADAAISKIHDAIEHLDAGRSNKAKTAFADAKNYMLFAIDSKETNQ